MTTSLPTLTAEERAHALEKAKEARRARAQFKQALEAGEKTFEDAFALCRDEFIGRLKVIDLLLTLPHVGDSKAEAIMNEIHIAPNRRLLGLGKRQIEELLEVEKKNRA